jgi:hypothetical protein
MAKFTEVRLTIAAFIYGIELDLKTIAKKYITPYHSDLSFLHNKPLEEEVIKRFQKDHSGTKIIENLDDAIDFIDFYDSFNVLIINEPFVPKNIYEELKSKIAVLKDICPIRNRVMHTRPLLGGDFAFIFDFISSLKRTDAIPWNITIDTRD